MEAEDKTRVTKRDIFTSRDKHGFIYREGVQQETVARKKMRKHFKSPHSQKTRKRHGSSTKRRRRATGPPESAEGSANPDPNPFQIYDMNGDGKVVAEELKLKFALVQAKEICSPSTPAKKDGSATQRQIALLHEYLVGCSDAEVEAIGKQAEVSAILFYATSSSICRALVA